MVAFEVSLFLGKLSVSIVYCFLADLFFVDDTEECSQLLHTEAGWPLNVKGLKATVCRWQCQITSNLK